MDAIYIVRAMPAQGHERRWCAQRPFTKTPIEVRVVDEPAPHKREQGGTRIIEYSYEVTPAELEELKRDNHLAVSIKGNPDADVDELNALKAERQRFTAELEQAKKDHQLDVEEAKRFRLGAEKLAAESAARLGEMAQKIANLEQQLAERSTKRR